MVPVEGRQRPEEYLNSLSETTRMPARSAGIHIALLAGYLVLATIHTYPLILHLDTHLAGQGLGDNVSFVWNVWWMREALASSSYDFFTNPLIEAPLGASLILHTHTALSAFLGATVLAPLSVVAAQNILLIVSLALNGMSAYLLSLVVTRARGPSILAGALFLVTPPITARLMGHYNLVLVWPLACACAAYVWWWRRPRVWTALVLAATAALIPYADYYYAVFFGVFAIAYAVVELWHVRIHAVRGRRSTSSTVLFALAAIAALAGIAIALSPAGNVRVGSATVSVSTPTNAWIAAWLLGLAAAVVRWQPRVRVIRRQSPPPGLIRSLGPALVVFALLLTPLIVPAWRSLSSGDYVTQTSSLKTGPHGVDLASLVLGPPFSGITGPLVRRAYQATGIDVMESSAWIGLAPILLLVMLLRRAPLTAEIRRWLAIAAVFGIWALGPYLIVLGHNTGLLLPQALAHVIPIVNNARIPARALAVCTLAMAIVIAAALSSPLKRPIAAWTLWTLLVLAIGESIGAPLPLAAIRPAGIYADVAASSESGAVLTVPFGVRDGFGEKGLLEHDALYGQTIHRRALAGGFLARLPRRVWSWYEETEPYRTLLALSTPGATAPPLPSCESILAGLRAGSISHVVLYRADASPALTSFVEDRIPVRRVGEDDERVLFAVDATRPGPCGP
jgi:hypothetical protein